MEKLWRSDEVTVPAAVVLGVLALWTGLQVLGGG
jgi:hypothetical protein